MEVGWEKHASGETSSADKALESARLEISDTPQLGRHGLDIRLDYIPNGARSTGIGFVSSVIKFLIVTANVDPKTRRNKIARSHNMNEGYLIEISSGYEDDDLAAKTIIEILEDLPSKIFE